MRKALFFLFLLVGFTAIAQIKDTTEALALARRCKNFDETKADSLLFYSKQLEGFSIKHDFKQGVSDAIRFKGMHFEYKGKFDTAIIYYLQNIDFAQKNLPPQKATALYSDLVAVYKITRQYDKAKDYALQMLRASEAISDSQRISSACLNLGIMYRSLKKSDSAFLYYHRALLLKEKLKDSLGMANLRVNMSAYYYNEGKYEEALRTILPNIEYHTKHNETGDLWYDYMNVASALIGLKRYEQAESYADKALPLTDTTNKGKLAEVYEMMGELFYQKGDYKKGYDYKEKGVQLERAQLNENTEKLMAEASEKFESEKKEQENQLLSAKLEKNKLQKKNTTIVAMAVSLLLLLIGWALWQQQKSNKKLTEKNEIINKQVDKLAELNSEKNSLISIVSHDLASPLGTIHVWSQVLQRKKENLDEKQQEAILHITQAAEQGQGLIGSILDIEKVKTGSHKISLSTVDLGLLLKRITGEYQQLAQNKQQELEFSAAPSGIHLLTDKELVGRIIENLLSNAIKYSSPGKKIIVGLRELENNVMICVKDEGQGIGKDKLANLFSKYSPSSSKPTAGERSTGLGLSIVKRLVDELNGKIEVESEPGRGSEFRVLFKK